MAGHRINSLTLNEHRFIFDPTSGHSYNANETAMLVISMFREGKKLTEIIASLIEIYDVTELVLRNDLGIFLEQLIQYGLISDDNDAGSSEG